MQDSDEFWVQDLVGYRVPVLPIHFLLLILKFS
jgi:hypothetical protein